MTGWRFGTVLLAMALCGSACASTAPMGRNSDDRATGGGGGAQGGSGNDTLCSPFGPTCSNFSREDCPCGQHCTCYECSPEDGRVGIWEWDGECATGGTGGTQPVGGSGGANGGAGTAIGGGGVGGGVAGTPETVVCSGLDGTGCGENEWCYHSPPSSCTLEAGGTCVARFAACSDACPGECGCDGRFYCSACRAAQVGVDVTQDMECLDSFGPGAACDDDSECAELLLCCDGECAIAMDGACPEP